MSGSPAFFVPVLACMLGEAQEPPGWIRDLDPTWMPPLLALACFLEHVFPPFPGDVSLLAGAWLLAVARRPLAPAWLGGFAGAVLGAFFVIEAGRRLETWRHRRQGLHRGRRRHRLLARLEPLRVELRRRGLVLILASRFVPVLRPLLLLAAGAAGVKRSSALAAAAASAALWNTLLFYAAAHVARSYGELAGAMQSYAFWAPLVAIAAFLVLFRRAFRIPTGGDPREQDGGGPTA